jgi:excisionase family DNA binding protein
VEGGGRDHLLTVRAAAARLGVSTATVYKLVARGDLPHIRVSNAIRLNPADLASYLDQAGDGMRRPPPPDRQLELPAGNALASARSGHDER